MDKEAIARIIDPKGWEYHDDHLRRAEKWEAEGKPADHALVGGYRNGAAYNVAESLAKATAILALQSSERGEAAQAREVANMRKAADDWRRPSLRQVEGPNDLKIYGGTIADDLDRWADMLERATLSPAEPSPESREGWQPIETAPRDGTEFLSAGGVNGTEGKAYSTRYLNPGPYSTENGKNTEGERRYQWPDGFYWAGYDGFVGPVDPTIWRPLPAPPASAIRALSAPAHD